MKKLKPISKSKYRKMAYRWTGEKAIVLYQQKNLGEETIEENEEVEITGRHDRISESLNIRSKTGVEIYGVHISHLSHVISENP